MTRLGQRLRKLEQAHPRDGSGLIPDTPGWMEYWLARTRRIYDGIEEQGPEKIPFAVMRAFMQSMDDDGE